MGQPLLSRSFEDLSVGDRQVTRGRTITETDLVQWCMFTADWFPLHTDKTVAEDSIFGQRIVPGLLVQAVAAGLVVPAETTSLLAEYGMDRLRFPAPTFIDDTIHVELEVLEKSERETGGLAHIEWRILNQNGTLVATCVNLALFDRRGDGTA
jgi:acyl dehydratase